MTRILALLALLLPGLATAAPREVDITASGLTRQDAITQGLVQALEQVSGVALVSLNAAKAELSETVKDEQKSSTLTAEQQSTTSKLTGGYVSAYRITDTADGPPVTVQMVVTVEVFEAKGLGNETRRRIAVATFGGTGRNSAVAEQLRDRISAHLVQARRFAVVDRAQDDAYANEMEVLRNDAPLAERTRIGQVIGADYIVTGRLRQSAGTSSSRLLDLTGEVVTSSTPGSAEADYQVIEIATRQIKWAGSARISGGGAVDGVAARIATEITQTIYPMRLIRFDDPANLIINQGGDALHAGQRYRAMVQGETMIDPYTHESLGELESEAGVVEIRRVDAKISYAQLVAGRLPAPAGADLVIVLRPAAAVAAAPARARRPARGGEAAGVVKLPGDP